MRQNVEVRVFIHVDINYLLFLCLLSFSQLDNIERDFAISVDSKFIQDTEFDMLNLTTKFAF